MKELQELLNEGYFKENEYEAGRKFFGDTLFVEPKSNKQVYKELSDADLSLFKKICNIKRLNLTGQWNLMTEALECVEKGKAIPESIKEKLILNSLVFASTLAFSYLCKYNTACTYGDFICEAYLALNKAFDKWLYKSDEEKARIL